MALGLESDLVAMTHECELPHGAQPIPGITRSTLPSETLPSHDIHKHVTAAAHGGSSLYVLDHALLEKCDPDLIITQELCDVCAIGYQQVAAAVRRLDEATATKRIILSVEPQTLPQILDAIQQIGAAAGVADRAAHLVDDMRERIDAISEVGRRATTQPGVLAMEWLDPPYTAGHWVPEMIRLAGGRDELGREGASRTRSAGTMWSSTTRRSSFSCRAASTWNEQWPTPPRSNGTGRGLASTPSRANASTLSTPHGTSAAIGHASWTDLRSLARLSTPSFSPAAPPKTPGDGSIDSAPTRRGGIAGRCARSTRSVCRAQPDQGVDPKRGEPEHVHVALVGDVVDPREEIHRRVGPVLA